MKHILTAALLCAAVAAARAAPDDDLRICRTANGEPALKACTAYLATPSLTPPMVALAHMLRAQTYIGEHKLTDALDDYAAATRAEPTNPDAWYSHAIVASALNQLDVAIADLTRAITLRPNWAQAYVARGAMHLAHNDPQKTIEDDTRALQLDPNNNDAKTDLATAQHRLNKL